jgi:hypothetical protein
MRVDVGLLIQRAPIFLHFRKRDAEYLKFKNDLMNEYYCNQKPFIEEFEEMSKLNDNIVGETPYTSKMNVDNYPSHRITDAVTGEVQEYCAASKLSRK